MLSADAAPAPVAATAIGSAAARAPEVTPAGAAALPTSHPDGVASATTTHALATRASGAAVLPTASTASSGTPEAGAGPSTALAGGTASGGLLPRATMVHSTTGTATIYNAQIEVGFVFDPSDNPNHRLQFNGPDVAKSEFTLHGDAVSDATVDGQPAVAGQWYPLHAGLTLTAVSAVAVHVRPVAPKTDG